MKAAGRASEYISFPDTTTETGIDRKTSGKSQMLEEQQKGSVPHTLARTMVLGYLVKMTTVQDDALPGESAEFGFCTQSDKLVLELGRLG